MKRTSHELVYWEAVAAAHHSKTRSLCAFLAPRLCSVCVFYLCVCVCLVTLQFLFCRRRLRLSTSNPTRAILSPPPPPPPKHLSRISFVCLCFARPISITSVLDISFEFELVGNLSLLLSGAFVSFYWCSSQTLFQQQKSTSTLS